MKKLINKKFIFLIFELFCLEISLNSCKTKKMFQATIIVYVDRQPTKDVNIGILDQIYCTDLEGKIFVIFKKNSLSKYQFKLTYEGLPSDIFKRMDTTFDSKIQKSPFINKFYLTSQLKPLEKTDMKADQLASLEKSKEKINLIASELNNAKIVLSQNESSLDNYLESHPNSAIGDYKAPFLKQKNDILEKQKMIDDLNSEYIKHKENITLGELVDIEEFNRQIILADKVTANMINNVKTLTTAFTVNVKAKPDIVFLTDDVFFGSGNYLLNSLTDKEKTKINKYTDKIKKLKDDNYSDYKPNNLRLKLKFVGYTDGVPVGDTLALKISKLCILSSDLNVCLSELRAREMFPAFSKDFKNYHTIADCTGKGDILAKNKNSNPSLRKCEVSFSLMPENLIDK